jgi:hypothetical protein
MQPRLLRIAVFTCVAVAAAAGMTACQGADTLVPADVDYCTIMADPPVKDGPHMSAPGRFLCDGKGADSITISVTLQKQAASGAWTSVKSATWTVKGTATTSALSQSDRTRNTTVTCATGEYRTLVHSVEKSEKHTFAYSTHSPTIISPCKR